MAYPPYIYRVPNLKKASDTFSLFSMRPYLSAVLSVLVRPYIEEQAFRRLQHEGSTQTEWGAPDVDVAAANQRPVVQK